MKALENSADQKIDDALHLFKMREIEFLAISPRTEYAAKTRDWASLCFIRKYRTTQHDLEKALEYIRTGSSTLHAMKLDVELDEKKLKELLAGLPSPQEFGAAR